MTILQLERSRVDSLPNKSDVFMSRVSPVGFTLGRGWFSGVRLFIYFDGGTCWVPEWSVLLEMIDYPTSN